MVYNNLLLVESAHDIVKNYGNKISNNSYFLYENGSKFEILNDNLFLYDKESDVKIVLNEKQKVINQDFLIDIKKIEIYVNNNIELMATTSNYFNLSNKLIWKIKKIPDNNKFIKNTLENLIDKNGNP